jgi:hypothetical protein
MVEAAAKETHGVASRAARRAVRAGLRMAKAPEKGVRKVPMVTAEAVRA